LEGETALAKKMTTKRDADQAGVIEPGTVFCDPLADGAEGPEMVALPPGQFLMGSPDSDADAEDNEKPQYHVTIGYAFAVGRYPVTEVEYHRFAVSMGRAKRESNVWPSHERKPANSVSWGDAKTYVMWLSEQTGREYRPLSEAEWEYACRAGTETRYAVGHEISPEDAVFGRSDSIPDTYDVGSHPPNFWNLCDMHGNVWEWVEDRWHDSYYHMPFPGAPTDGSAWMSGGDADKRVQRGGSMYEDAKHLRSASRNWQNIRDPGSYYDFQIRDDGFRVARTLDQ
jgi:formylglycine-generating enzyme required for sulfatase activity